MSEQQHPFLQDPENARGYAQLLAVPIGTVRTWARSLGWSAGKMQRFLASLSRYQLGEIQSCKTHSVFRPVNSPINPKGEDANSKVYRSVSVCTGTHRYASAALGSSGLGGKEPSATAEAGSEYSRALITAMNDALLARFTRENYRPVLTDNDSSLAAADRLERAGVPLGKAEAHLLVQCRLFNPSKHGKGDLPKSLAYFERGILKAWKTEAQLTIPLMQLERSNDPGPRYQEFVPPANDLPTAKPETIDAVAQDWRAIASSPTRPRRP